MNGVYEEVTVVKEKKEVIYHALQHDNAESWVTNQFLLIDPTGTTNKKIYWDIFEIRDWFKRIGPASVNTRIRFCDHGVLNSICILRKQKTQKCQNTASGLGLRYYTAINNSTLPKKFQAFIKLPFFIRNV